MTKAGRWIIINREFLFHFTQTVNIYRIAEVYIAVTNKEKFIQIYQENITREGSDRLLAYLCSDACDFFTAPASSRYHSAFEGGLCEHSLNVYECLVDYMNRHRVKDLYGVSYSAESIAIAALLHDLCKINFYKTSFRNVKDENGRWQSVPFYTIEDSLPYGHGEKSVYIATGYMRLTRDEAFAIRYHMGFSEDAQNNNNVAKSFEMFPLAFALSVADQEATYFMESSPAK